VLGGTAAADELGAGVQRVVGDRDDFVVGAGLDQELRVRCGSVDQALQRAGRYERAGFGVLCLEHVENAVPRTAADAVLEVVIGPRSRAGEDGAAVERVHGSAALSDAGIELAERLVVRLAGLFVARAGEVAASPVADAFQLQVRPRARADGGGETLVDGL